MENIPSKEGISNGMAIEIQHRPRQKTPKAQSTAVQFGIAGQEIL